MCRCDTCVHRPDEQRQREMENPQASFWRHRLRLPHTQWTLSGHSRALERSGFLLEEPRIFLDAGVGGRNPTNGACNAVLVTHTHIDHINALPLLARTGGPKCDPAFVAPREHVNEVREFTRMSWGIKGEDGSDRAGRREDVVLKPVPPLGTVVGVEAAGTRDPVPEGVPGKGRLWVPATPGVRLRLQGAQGVVVDCVRCFHTLIDAGFVISESKTVTYGVDEAAQTEYEALLERCKVDKKAGREIGALYKAGRLRRRAETVPRVAYLCDTTTQVFGTQCAACAAGGAAAACAFASRHGAPCDADAAARAAQRRLLLSCSTIIVECSFLGAAGMSDEEAAAEAVRRGHASWTQLREHVEASPEITFILVHFSLRYKDSQIRDYFRTAGSDGGRPANVVLWLDSGLDEPPAPPVPGPAEEADAAAGAQGPAAPETSAGGGAAAR